MGCNWRKNLKWEDSSEEIQNETRRIGEKKKNHRNTVEGIINIKDKIRMSEIHSFARVLPEEWRRKWRKSNIG